MSSEAKLPMLIAEVESATHHRHALYACLSDLTLIPNTGLNDSGKALYARLRVDRCNHHRHALYACLFDLTLIPNTGLNDSGKALMQDYELIGATITSMPYMPVCPIPSMWTMIPTRAYARLRADATN